MAPVDAGDGYGANLADIRSGTWSQAAGARFFAAVVKSAPGGAVRPSPGASMRYHALNGLLAVYAACEQFTLGLGPDPEEKIQTFRAAFPEQR